MKIKTCILTFFILSLGLAFGQSESEALQPIKIDTTEIRKYSNFKEMLDKESFDCLQEINTHKGFAFWGFKIGIKKWNKWIVIDQPSFNINENCDLIFISADFLDINQTGEPELILRFENQMYGNRGETVLEYIQIWDTDSKILIFENLTKEHFYWFSKEEQGICERVIEYESGKIKVGRSKCNGKTDIFDLAKENNERIYFLNNGKWKLK